MYEYDIEVTINLSGQKTTFPVLEIRARDESDLQVRIKEFATQYYEDNNVEVFFDEDRFNHFYVKNFSWEITHSQPVTNPH